jgi:hypothetical protein
MKLIKLIFALFLAVGPGASGQADHLAVVVSPDVPLDNLSFYEIRQIFLGSRQFWAPNLRVTLLMQAPGTREHEAALKYIYQMTEAQFRQYWISKVFRAEASSGPKKVFSQAIALEILTLIPGTVVLLDSSQVPKSLKILKINGILPGEQGYTLP